MNNADKLIEQLSRQLNTTPGQLRQDAESGDINDMLGRADPESANKVREVLADPEKTRALLNSPQAKALIKLLSRKREGD